MDDKIAQQRASARSVPMHTDVRIVIDRKPGQKRLRVHVEYDADLVNSIVITATPVDTPTLK